MKSTRLILYLCLGFTFCSGNLGEDDTDIRAVLRKVLSETGKLKNEIWELKNNNVLLKQEVREIILLKNKIRSLEKENSMLKNGFGNLEEEVKTLRIVIARECCRENDSCVNSEVESSNNSPRIQLNRDAWTNQMSMKPMPWQVHQRNQEERKRSPDTLVATSNTVAFFVYMAHTEPYPSAHHRLVFDVIKLNLGNGYSRYTGAFSAPEDGVYAFSYGITCGLHGSLYFQFLKNGDILIDKRCDNDQGSDDYKELSGTIIAQLNSNDVFYMSTKKASSTHITSYEDSRSFLSGWKIN